MIVGPPDDSQRHDILTGSQPDGRAFADDADHTCQNWTSNFHFRSLVFLCLILALKLRNSHFGLLPHFHFRSDDSGLLRSESQIAIGQIQ